MFLDESGRIAAACSVLLDFGDARHTVRGALRTGILQSAHGPRAGVERHEHARLALGSHAAAARRGPALRRRGAHGDAAASPRLLRSPLLSVEGNLHRRTPASCSSRSIRRSRWSGIGPRSRPARTINPSSSANVGLSRSPRGPSSTDSRATSLAIRASSRCCSPRDSGRMCCSKIASRSGRNQRGSR
jgi:hypothetical protein